MIRTIDHFSRRRSQTLRLAVVLAILFVGTSIARAQDSLDGLPAIPPPIGSPTDQKDPRWGKPRVAALVAKIIEPDELRNYALVLHLSEAQRAAFREAYLAYRQRMDQLNTKHFEPVATLAVEAADTQAHPYDWEYLRLLTELREAEARYQRDLIEEDQAFMNAVQLMLAEPQKVNFERVKLRRDRKRCQPYMINISPGYIDLVDLVQQHITDEDVLGDLDPLLLEYERLITPQYLKIDKAKRRTALTDTRDMVAAKYADDGKTLLEPGSPEAVARATENRQRRIASLAETIPQQERLADINRQFIERLKSIIPAEQFSPLWKDYLRQAFPYIHPDKCDPTDLMQRMITAKGLDPGIRDLMQARCDSWRKTYDTMTRQMEDHYIQYSVAFARTFSSEHEHTPAIRKLRLDRWTASDEALKAMYAMLPEDLRAAFDKPLKQYQKRLADEFERETNPQRGNP